MYNSNWFCRNLEFCMRASALRISWTSKCFSKTYGPITPIRFRRNTPELALWKQILLAPESERKLDCCKTATDRLCATTRTISPMALDRSAQWFIYCFYCPSIFYCLKLPYLDTDEHLSPFYYWFTFSHEVLAIYIIKCIYSSVLVLYMILWQDSIDLFLGNHVVTSGARMENKKKAMMHMAVNKNFKISDHFTGLINIRYIHLFCFSIS